MAAESIAYYQERIKALEALVTSRAFLTDYVPRQSLESERLRGDDLWADLQQAYRAVAEMADEVRDLKAALAHSELDARLWLAIAKGQRNARLVAERELEDLRDGTHPTHRVTLKSLGDPAARDAHYQDIIDRLGERLDAAEDANGYRVGG